MKKRKTLSGGEAAAITARARAYVDAQLATMARYGSAPTLTQERYEKLVHDCAKPAIEIALWSPGPVRATSSPQEPQ